MATGNSKTNSTQGARMLVKGCFELAVSAADLCGRSCDNAKVSQVLRLSARRIQNFSPRLACWWPRGGIQTVLSREDAPSDAAGI